MACLLVIQIKIQAVCAATPSLSLYSKHFCSLASLRQNAYDETPMLPWRLRTFAYYVSGFKYKCRQRRCPESHSKFTFLSGKNVIKFASICINMKTTTIVVRDKWQFLWNLIISMFSGQRVVQIKVQISKKVVKKIVKIIVKKPVKKLCVNLRQHEDNHHCGMW